MDVLLGPRHFRDVHQTLDTGLQLDEGAVIGDVGDAAGMHRGQRILGADQIPRIFLQLLHAEADAVGVLVDLDDLYLDGLADRQDLGRVVDPAPCHVGDVQQAVDTAQIHEGAVFGDVLDHTIDILALGEVGDDLGALLGAAFFEDGAARHDDIAAAAIHLEDLERLLEPHQRAGIAHRAHIDLAAGQEGHGTAKIDGEAALDAAEDRTLDALLVGIGLFETVPSLFTAGHFAADDGLALGVLGRAQKHLDLVTDGDVRLLAGIGEFLEFDAAFHLVADIDDGLARLYGDHLALDDSALLGRVHFEAFFKEGFEVLHGCVLSHVVSGFLYTFIFPAARLSPPVLGVHWSGGSQYKEGRGCRPCSISSCRDAVHLIDDKRHTGRSGINQVCPTERQKHRSARRKHPDFSKSWAGTAFAIPAAHSISYLLAWTEPA